MMQIIGTHMGEGRVQMQEEGEETCADHRCHMEEEGGYIIFIKAFCAYNLTCVCVHTHKFKRSLT